MGLREAEKAVDGLHTYTVANLQTYLTEIEGERDDLEAGDLEPPKAYISSFQPFDNRSPLVMIYEQGFRPTSPSGAAQRNGFYEVPCVLLWSWFGGTDFDANELRMRRYIGASVRMIDADPTLGGVAYQTLIKDADARRRGPRKKPLYWYGLLLGVQVDRS